MLNYPSRSITKNHTVYELLDVEHKNERLFVNLFFTVKNSISKSRISVGYYEYIEVNERPKKLVKGGPVYRVTR